MRRTKATQTANGAIFWATEINAQVRPVSRSMLNDRTMRTQALLPGCGDQ